WVRKWIELTLALVFSKVILVTIFVVGLDVMDNSLGQSGTGVTQTVTQIATGLLILCVAGLAPWLAVRMVHFASDHFASVHAHAQSATAGAAAAVTAPQKIKDWASDHGIGGKAGSSKGGGDQVSTNGTRTRPEQNGQAAQAGTGGASKGGA